MSKDTGMAERFCTQTLSGVEKQGVTGRTTNRADKSEIMKAQQGAWTLPSGAGDPMKGFKKKMVRSDLLSGYFLLRSEWRMVG